MSKIIVQDEDGEEYILVTKMEVCPTCQGTSTIVNPAIDGNGITGEEMDELGEDFREDYLKGVYDVPCPECKGQNVIAVPDPDRNPPAALFAYDAHLREEAEFRAMQEAERRAGC